MLQGRICSVNRSVIYKQSLNFNRKGFLRIICSVLLVISISGCEVIYSSALMVSCSIRSALKVSPEKLPVAIIDQPYQVVFSASKNQTPIGDFYLSSGQLPAGIKFLYVDNPSGEYRATLEGIPTEVGNFPITIATWSYGTQCTGQSGSREYILTIKSNIQGV